MTSAERPLPSRTRISSHGEPGREDQHLSGEYWSRLVEEQGRKLCQPDPVFQPGWGQRLQLLSGVIAALDAGWHVMGYRDGILVSPRRRRFVLVIATSIPSALSGRRLLGGSGGFHSGQVSVLRMTELRDCSTVVPILEYRTGARTVFRQAGVVQALIASSGDTCGHIVVDVARGEISRRSPG